MTIDRISYQKVFPIGSYVNEKIGLEASLGEGENIDEAFKEIKAKVESLHYENNPHLHQEQDIPITKLVSPVNEKDTKPKTPEEKIIAEIATVKDLNILIAYQFIAKKYPSIKEAVENKRKELTA